MATSMAPVMTLVFESGVWIRRRCDRSSAGLRADAVTSSGTCVRPASTALSPGEEADAVGVDQADQGAGGDSAWPSPTPSRAVERNEGKNDAHRHHRTRYGVANCGEPGGKGGRTAPDGGPVGDEQHGGDTHDCRQRRELDGVTQELEEAFGVGCPAAGDLAERPRGELERQCTEGQKEDERANLKASQALGLLAARPSPAAAPAASPKRAAPHDAFESDDHQGNNEHEGGEFGGGVSVKGAAPDPEHPD